MATVKLETVECPNCPDKNNDELLQDITLLKKTIENLKSWLRDIPLELADEGINSKQAIEIVKATKLWVENIPLEWRRAEKSRDAEDLVEVEGQAGHHIYLVDTKIVKQCDQMDSKNPTGLMNQDMTVAALEEDPLREPKEEETMIGIVKEELMEDTYDTASDSATSQPILITESTEENMDQASGSDPATSQTFMKTEITEECMDQGRTGEKEHASDFDTSDFLECIVKGEPQDESESGFFDTLPSIQPAASSALVFKHPCNQCEYVALTSRNLAQHTKIQHLGRTYPCGKCDFISLDYNTLGLHMNSKHPRKFTYPCDECEYGATTLRFLQCHKESKHVGFINTCDESKYQGTNPDDIKRHQENRHEGIRYPCGECEYEATTESSLKRHKENIHEGIRYPCDYCKYAATEKGNLTKHKRRRHNE